MAQTAVNDVVIWVKHVHGDDAVGSRVLNLRSGETIELVVDGYRGVWRKMDDGRDGRPTHGIRPIGRTQEFWKELYASRRGDLVKIELAPAQDDDAKVTNSFRQAAREALLQGLTGFRSSGDHFARDDLHDRDLDRRNL